MCSDSVSRGARPERIPFSHNLPPWFCLLYLFVLLFVLPNLFYSFVVYVFFKAFQILFWNKVVYIYICKYRYRYVCIHVHIFVTWYFAWEITRKNSGEGISGLALSPQIPPVMKVSHITSLKHLSKEQVMWDLLYRPSAQRVWAGSGPQTHSLQEEEQLPAFLWDTSHHLPPTGIPWFVWCCLLCIFAIWLSVYTNPVLLCWYPR